MVECNLAKVEVAGSNPVSRSTKSKPYASKAFFVRGHNSTVECQLPKLKVTGSNPAARSREFKGCKQYAYSPFLFSNRISTIGGEKYEKREAKEELSSPT